MEEPVSNQTENLIRLSEAALQVVEGLVDRIEVMKADLADAKGHAAWCDQEIERLRVAAAETKPPDSI